MPRTQTNLSADGCPAVRDVVHRVGDKWSVSVVACLATGAKRFSSLRRSIAGISQRMLTLTLRALERDGVLTRTMQATIPPRVDYALTDLGQTLVEPVLALANWAGEHRVDIGEARGRYDGLVRSASAAAMEAPRPASLNGATRAVTGEPTA